LNRQTDGVRYLAAQGAGKKEVHRQFELRPAADSRPVPRDFHRGAVSMRVYEAIIKGLEGIGVDAAFGGAGENAASLLLALKHSTKIKPVIVRHEQAASFMACGYAIYSNRLGVCFATAGPGAFNLFSGLAVAMSDSYPVLAISGFASLEWRGKGALNETSGFGGTPDSQAMFAATTKRSFLLQDAAQTCDVLEEAVNVAFEGRPGPVHIHVPENLTHVGVSVDNYRDIKLDVRPVIPDPATISAAAGLLADAMARKKRILALIGFGAIRSRAGDELRTLIERFQIPFVTTLDGKGIIPEDHPLALGVFADSGHGAAGKAFVEADLVLAVGNSFAQHATSQSVIRPMPSSTFLACIQAIASRVDISPSAIQSATLACF
jgi:acetolactate synthase-1/2/3 large subunit